MSEKKKDFINGIHSSMFLVEKLKRFLSKAKTAALKDKNPGSFLQSSRGMIRILKNKISLIEEENDNT